MTRDAMLDTVLGTSRNMAVPWFLMASYLYYHRDVPLLSDERFDQLARELDAGWDTIEHHHKHVIDREALGAGTGYSIALDRYPMRCVHAACMLAKIKAPPPLDRLPRARVRVRNPVHVPG